MEGIADDVSGATVAIVEQVLEEYGDPGEPSGEVDSDDDDPISDADSDERREAPDPDSTGTERVAADSDEPESTMSEHDSRSDARPESALEPEDVTEKQLETLEEIYERPDATQAALADTLGVSSATISQRVNAIDEFSWPNRREFVTALFDDGDWFEDDGGTLEETDRTDSKPEADSVADGRTAEGTATDRNGTDDADALERNDPIDERDVGRTEIDGGDAAESTEPDGERAAIPESHTDGGTETRASGRRTESDAAEMRSAAGESIAELSEQLEAVTRRLEALETRLADDSSQAPSSNSRAGVLTDPELAHKVVHACLTADHISEEEELQLLKEVTATDTGQS